MKLVVAAGTAEEMLIDGAYMLCPTFLGACTVQATRLVPGSHRWPQHRVPLESDAVYAEMPAGSVVFISGMTYHSAGGNSTDTPRLGMNLDFNAGFIAEEEVQVLSVSKATGTTCRDNKMSSSGQQLVLKSSRLCVSACVCACVACTCCVYVQAPPHIARHFPKQLQRLCGYDVRVLLPLTSRRHAAVKCYS